MSIPSVADPTENLPIRVEIKWRLPLPKVERAFLGTAGKVVVIMTTWQPGGLDSSSNPAMY